MDDAIQRHGLRKKTFVLNSACWKFDFKLQNEFSKPLKNMENQRNIQPTYFDFSLFTPGVPGLSCLERSCLALVARAFFGGWQERVLSCAKQIESTFHSCTCVLFQQFFYLLFYGIRH